MYAYPKRVRNFIYSYLRKPIIPLRRINNLLGFIRIYCYVL
uniref:Uncharacterized protein n=1 Tax=virus sp. ct8MV80 TaxID=2826793 RepID=A0A8S5R840_9VIRU|nr:MAG TPA: hypothetical protein [virus sp. ct8MV80]